jgi:acyl-CoA synthetase (AMP-forming)/AMP-acid ligase II
MEPGEREITVTEFSLMQVFGAVAEAVPARPALVWRTQVSTFGELARRAGGLATFLAVRGLGAGAASAEVPHWASAHDHVAIMARNRPEWIEAMLGCYRARVVPFNVNYRYTVTELAEVLRLGRPRAIVFEASYAPIVAVVASSLPGDVTLLQVADESGNDLLDGALEYESTVRAMSAAPCRLPASRPDDRYLLLTGGTTGRPKGVLWRQADLYVAALQGFRKPGTPEIGSLAEVLARIPREPRAMLPAPPLMHGSAQWAVLAALLSGQTVVLADTNTRFDAAEAVGLVERREVYQLVIGGDAFARPIIEALRGSRGRMACLRVITTGAVALSSAAERQLRGLLPHVTIVDAAGASETGPQMRRSAEAGGARPGAFAAGDGTCVLAGDRSRPLPPDSREIGWLARTGRVPLGYLDEPDLTMATFPVRDGVRYAIPGDRARYAEEGAIELLGRDAVVINTGGEKVFAEEVEEALAGHPDVYDALVVGCPHKRWGQEVVAVVALRPRAQVSPDGLRTFLDGRLARYKIPKRVVVVEAVTRSAAGKPDYGWALEQARAAAARWS